MRTIRPQKPASNLRASQTPVRRTLRFNILSPGLTELKHRLQREFALAVPGSERVLAAALREAEALAWKTGFPQLVFPLLAEEKAQGARQWHIRQQELRRQSPTWTLAE